jgi:hypothetical protein
MMTSLLQCLYGLFVHIVSLVPKKEYYFYYKIAIIASKAAMVGFSVPHSMGGEASAPPSMARAHMEKK